MNNPDNAEHLLKALDQCVVCGLCIPHCPTYPLTQREGDSPRGRIALMQGLVTGRLADSLHANEAIARCLGCRACETVCPAQVPYGAALAEFKLTEPTARRKPPALLRLARKISGHSALMNLATAAAKFYLSLPGRRASRGRLSRLARYATGSVPVAKRRTSPKAEGERGKVLLFPGCVVPGAAPSVAAAAGRVLNYLGYGVILPEKTTCCGALSLAEGDERDLRAHISAVASLSADRGKDLPLISLASGCSSQVKLYGNLPRLSDADVAWSSGFIDFLEFVDNALAESAPRFTPGSAKVAIHEPCSLRHGLRKPGLTRRVLAAIPGLELHTLPASFPCCGAAGSNMFSQPQIADALAEKTVDALLELRPDIVVSANIGCALHIQAELLRRGSQIAVAHPAELLERHLPG